MAFPLPINPDGGKTLQPKHSALHMTTQIASPDTGGIEQLEMSAQRAQLTADVKNLVEKYRSIFDWDVPEVDEALSDRLILKAVRQVLDDIEKASAVSTP